MLLTSSLATYFFFLLCFHSFYGALSDSRLQSDSSEFFSSLFSELSFSEFSTSTFALSLPHTVFTDGAAALDLI